MAAAKGQGQVILRGRFPAGARVDLVKVKGPETLRTDPSDKVVDSARVGDDRSVEFTKDIEVGARYFIRGRVDGIPREVRVTGAERGEESAVLSQSPVGNDDVKLGSGKTLAEHAAESESIPPTEVQPGAKQSHARDIAQRSSTPVGYATPVDPDEIQPYGRQEDGEGYDQRSDTATGQAALMPHEDSPPVKQEDAPDTLVQRSATPHGVTTPLPAGDAVQASLDRDAQASKDQGGTEPNKAAARPVEGRKQPRQSSRKRSSGKKKSGAKKSGGKKSSGRKRSR